MAFLKFVVCRGGRNEHRAAHLALELIKAQRPVIQCTREPEAVINQCLLAGTVTAVHPAKLPDHHMALVKEHQTVRGKIVNQAGRRFAGGESGQMPGVVFNTLAETHLIEHLKVKLGALLQTLRFDHAALVVELLETFGKLDLDTLHGADNLVTRRHIVTRRIHHKAGDFLLHATGERVKKQNGIDLVVKKLNTHCALGMFGREHINRIAAHTERAANKLRIGPLVLHAHELRDQILLGAAVTFAHNAAHLRVALGFADTVNCRHGGDNNGVATFKNRLRGGKAHLFDVFVDSRILLNKEIAGRHIRLRLIKIVVGDKVFDRILREKLAHFGIGLSRERLVRCHDQRRHSLPGNHIGHRIGFTRSGHPQQGLRHQPLFEPFTELFNRRGLIACRRKRLMKPEGGIWISHHSRHSVLQKIQLKFQRPNE